MTKAGPYRQLRDLPGVGRSIEQDLWLLGYRKPEELARCEPERDYERWRRLTGVNERCMLYLLRCVAYAVKTPQRRRDPRLLRWWAWRDGRPTSRRARLQIPKSRSVD